MSLPIIEMNSGKTKSGILIITHYRVLFIIQTFLYINTNVYQTQHYTAPQDMLRDMETDFVPKNSGSNGIRGNGMLVAKICIVVTPASKSGMVQPRLAMPYFSFAAIPCTLILPLCCLGLVIRSGWVSQNIF